MKKKIIIVTLILAVIILASIFSLKMLLHPSFLPESITIEPSANMSLEKPKNPLEDVPYCSQETGFFCFYASCTMIFQYLGIDTNLREVLYYSGVGYSLIHRENAPLVEGGTVVAQSSENMEFLSSIYGLSFSYWLPDTALLSDEKCWQEYWLRVKENISHGLPILTGVEPSMLPSVRQQFDIPKDVWDKLYLGGHSIVVVGYNETNGTVCYNDPAAGYFGKTIYGVYAWMNLSDFRKAVERHPNRYLIYVFKKISDPMPEKEAFELAHRRNIERLIGNHSLYKSQLGRMENLELGIYAAKALKEDFSTGLKHRLRTSFIYKHQGREYLRWLVKNSFYLFLHKVYHPYSFLKSISSEENIYGWIALEKQYTAEYLKTLGSQKIKHEADLFENETQQWRRLSSYYNLFLEKNILIRLPRAIYIIKNMKNILDNIISIEEEITLLQN